MDSGLGSRVETWKLVYNIEIGGHTKKSNKNNKKSKRLQLQGEIRENSINYFTRKKNGGDLIQSFKIIDAISNYCRHFFQYILLKVEIYFQDIFQN